MTFHGFQGLTKGFDLFKLARKIMGRDKAKDDKYFNCNQEHELDYVSSLYPDPEKIRSFLAAQCFAGNFNYSTHQEVYKAIRDKFGYGIPS